MTTSHALPMLLEEVTATRVERLSPSFVRVELGGPGLADFGVDGPLLDQRIKLIFPPADGPLPSFAGADESWFETWLDRPVEERGHMRTYTVRDVRGSGPDTRLVVDLVLHGHGGEAGPGSSWASRAAVGDRLVVLAPRAGLPFGGIEFDPGEAGRLLLAGDETAVPAACAILEQLAHLAPEARGAAFLEVPVAGDACPVAAPSGVEVVWLPREGAAHGVRLQAAVASHLGGGSPTVTVPEDEVDPDLWETPTYSSSGQRVDAQDPTPEAARDGAVLDDLYAWIAGESKLVTGLRRALVNELGVDRRQVAFMGYWRAGVAMRA